MRVVEITGVLEADEWIPGAEHPTQSFVTDL